MALGCDWDLNRKGGDPPRAERAGEPVTTELPLSAAEAERSPRPSTDENMGRGFQGSIELTLRTPAGRRGLRYLARGNDARLQLDGLQGRGALDTLIWGEKIAVIDNAARTYRSFPLDDVKETDEPRNVRVDKTGERRTLSGVTCERYEIDDGPLHISAWVSAIPGTFEVDKLETVASVDVPAWVEELIAQDLLPLDASARDAKGKEAYAIELTRYAPGPVDESAVALPTGYRASDAMTAH